jgi:hypothetical protein
MNIFKGLTKKLGIMGIALLSLSMSNLTYAGPIVDTWSFDTWAEFTNSTFSAGSGTSTETLNALTWGATGGDFTNVNAASDESQSALTLGTTTSGDSRFGGGNVTGQIDTIMGGGPPIGSQIGIGISATHWNNILSGSFGLLTGGTLTDYLNLNAFLPNVGPVKAAPTIAIDFKFQETPNSGSGGFCQDGSAVPANGCPDIFGFAADLTVGIPFVYDGNLYAIDVLLSDGNGGAAPIDVLDDGYCSALDLANGCAGLVTPEDAVTSFQFGFDIRHVRSVPEPSTLVLLALAMIFMGAKKRRFNLNN